MKIIISISALLTFLGIFVSGANIPRNVKGFKILGHSQTRHTVYYYSNEGINWFEAKIGCEAMGAQFLAVEDSIENKDLYDFLHLDGDVPAAWISGNDLLSNANFIWESTNQPFGFTDWLNGISPSNPNLSCVSATLQSNGKYAWEENECTERKHAICELEICFPNCPAL